MYESIADFYGFAPYAPANTPAPVVNGVAPTQPSVVAGAPSYHIGSMAVPGWFVGIVLALAATKILVEQGARVD